MTHVSPLSENYYHLTRFHDNLVHFQNPVPPLNCKFSQAQCFNAERAAQTIETSLMLVEPGYDSWQVSHSWLVDNLYSPPKETWRPCIDNLSHCSKAEMGLLNLYNW